MTRAEIDRLLALYSSGAISAADRDALFRAALDDPALFEELFEEDTLREALRDPDVRAAALASPVSVPSAPRAAQSRWTWWRWPAFAAVAAAAVLMIVVVRKPTPVRPPAVELAQNRTPASAPQAVTETVQPAPRTSSAVSPAAAPARQAQVQEKRTETDRQRVVADAAPAQAPEAVTLMAESKPRSGDLGPADGGSAGRVSAAPSSSAAPVPGALRAGAGAAEPAVERQVQVARSEPVEVSLLRSDERLAKELERPARSVGNVTASKAESAPAPAIQRAASLVTATLSARASDGSWDEVAVNGTISQDTPLRLTIVVKASGVVSFTPAFTPPVALRSGESRVFDLPRQDTGVRALRVLLRRSAPVKVSAAREVFGAASGVAPVDPSTPTGDTNAVEIRFRIR